MRAWAFLSTAFAAATAAVSVDPIVIKGKHFFYKTNGTEFFIRGVAYQEGVDADGTVTTTSYVDPLANATTCARDIPYLVKLRTNVIRVYSVDPTLDHDDCMNMFAEAGIYIISDLSDPTLSINRNDPAWNYQLYNRYTSVIDMFSKYTNVLGYFAGNEVSNSANLTAASAFVKAAVRDTKAYIAEKGYQSVGVGYASYDGPIRTELADYFACGPSTDVVDFWGYNIYSWCGNSNYVESDYKIRTEEFRDYPFPAFFAEYGCITPPRNFDEVVSLFSTNMTGVWSGGIVFMYFQEANDYGLVTIANGAVQTLAPFNALSTQMASVTPATTAYADYTATGTVSPTCPTLGPQWSAVASPLPPTPNEQLCNCMQDTLGCVPAPDLQPTAYGAIFKYVCGLKENTHLCDGIAALGNTGQYGAYGACSDEQKLGYVMNQYWNYEGQAAAACSFDGQATAVSAASATGTCSSLIAAAGTNGANIVTASAGSNGGSNTASSGATSTGAAYAVRAPSFDGAYISMGLYIITAVVSGVGMLLL